jgi:hypothetical protein
MNVATTGEQRRATRIAAYRWAGWTSIALAAALAAGCADDGKATVSGRVLLDGKPLERGTIGFLPADGQAPSAAARIEDGSYVAEVAPGPKKVEILGFRVVGQEKHDPRDPSSPMVDVTEQFLPDRYNKATELTCEIADSRGDLDFALSSP